MAARINTNCAVQPIDCISCDRGGYSAVSLVRGQDLGNNKCILVCGGRNFIYLYRNQQRRAIFHFAQAVQRFTSRTADNKQLWCLTTDGKLYCLNIDRYLKKKKKQHKKKTRKDDVDMNTSNQDIFTDLLIEEPADGDSDDIEVEIEVSTDSVIQVDDSSMCLQLANMKNFLLYQEYIITAAKAGNTCSWNISIYLNDFLTRSIDSEETRAQDDTALYTVVIPGSQSVCSDINQSLFTDFTTQHFPKENQHSVEDDSNCTLVGIVPPGVSLNAVTEQIIVLESGLYTSLFGSDNYIIDCPVILIGIPDGKIYFLPLKNIRKANTLNIDPSRNQRSPDNNLSPLVPLYDIEQCLMNIHGICLPNKAERPANERTESQSCFNAVLLAGRDGRIVIISDRDRKLDFKEYYVSGPVTSSSVSDTGELFIYSSPTDVYHVRLVNRHHKQEGSAGSERKTHAGDLLPNVLIPTSTGISGILSLSPFTEEGIIYAIRHNGQLVCVTMEMANLEDDLPWSVSPSVAGQRMKEALAGISSTAERLAKMKVTSELQDGVLRELNCAADLTCSALEEGKGRVLESQFLCTQQCVIQDRGHHCNYGVTVRLENLTRTLDSAWTWIVCLQCPGSDGTTTSQHYTRTVPICRFHPGDFREIYIPFDDITSQICLPVQLSYHLHFDLQHLLAKLSPLPDDEIRKSNITITNNGICLNIGSCQLDVLHFLRPASRSSTRPSMVTNTAGSRHKKLMRQLREILRQRPGSVDSHMGPHALHTVSSTLLISAATIMSRGEDIPPESIPSGPQRPECKLLAHLLSGNPNRDLVMNSKESTMKMMTPDGEDVTLQTHRVTEDDRDVFELTISASSLHLLCQVHEATLQRIQSLRHNGQSSDMNVHTLQQEMRRVKNLLQELQTLEDKFHSGQDVSLAAEVLELYKKLRASTFLVM